MTFITEHRAHLTSPANFKSHDRRVTQHVTSATVLLGHPVIFALIVVVVVDERRGAAVDGCTCEAFAL